MTQSDRGDIPSSESLTDLDEPIKVTDAVDEDPPASNQRIFSGGRNYAFATACAAYTLFHLLVMNLYPLETWTYRLLHLGGGLALGLLLFGAHGVDAEKPRPDRSLASTVLLGLSAAGILYGAMAMALVWGNWWLIGDATPPMWTVTSFGIPLTIGTALAIVHGWLFADHRIERFTTADVLLAISSTSPGRCRCGPACQWHSPLTCGPQSSASC
jgi:hypothetical protein